MTVEETIQRELSCAMQAERYLYPRDHSLLHASAIGSCRRKQGFELMGVDGFLTQEKMQEVWGGTGKPTAEPHDSHFLSICDIGHGVHKMIQNRLVNVLGWCKPENVELEVRNEEYGIMGHIDALSNRLVFDSDDRIRGDWNEGKQYVIDIKTITSRAYLKRHPDTGVLHYDEPSSFERLTAPKKEHLLQTNVYAWMAKEMGLVDELPRIMVIYVAKDVDSEEYPPDHPDRLLSIPYKVFVRDAEEEHINAALKRAKHIWSRIKAGELPGRDHWCNENGKDWHCCCCSYRKTCYPEYFGDDLTQLTDASRSIIESYGGKTQV
jgi:hypothetical protein